VSSTIFFLSLLWRTPHHKLVDFKIASAALARMTTRNTEPTAPDAHQEAELRRLREDNEALRFANLKFGELAERLGNRVRELERLLGLRQTAHDE
jgi:hypothetical protein